ncbi:MAG: glycerol-3-phosphate 1-O-acyltransferase PlsY [Candidatus Omnitrophica bacterium]|nr:glycerol-3-phosphate 1-O-acyltransferase PlsY [Candidatus Omnitrophota bacterium]
MTDIVNISWIAGKLALVLGLSYLMGSIPTAFLFGKILKGIDIRQHGSGNVGATNAFRVLGKGTGTVVLLLDIIKGIVPVVVFAGILTPDPLGCIVAGMGAVCGHNWTCFLNFKGGKGIATSLGVLIGLTVAIPAARPAVLLCVLSWLTCFVITAYVSVSSIVAGIFLPILMIVFGAPFLVILLSLLFCVFIVLKHRPNIHRLLIGQEPKVPMPWASKKPS